MKKNQVDAILTDQYERRKKILNSIINIVILIIIALVFLILYINNSRNYYVDYNENSNIDYYVYLKQNEFFDKHYLESNNQYVASLIDYISADFNYGISLEEKNVNFQYTYRIDAEVIVKEKNTGYILYDFTNQLLPQVNKNSDSESNIEIKEKINIDYNYYNNIVQKFINVYNLDNTESTLMIKMYVDTISSCENFKEDSNNSSILTLEIPLAEKTIAIDINDNLSDANSNVILCKKNNILSALFLIITIGVVSFVSYLSIKLCKYVMSTRTAESIYERELKKILNNYRSYIQKINNDFDFKGYQTLKVDTFNDMLEIRDTIQQPILMVEDKVKQETFFLIPSKTKILYQYILKIQNNNSQVKSKSGKRASKKEEKNEY